MAISVGWGGVEEDSGEGEGERRGLGGVDCY